MKLIKKTIIRNEVDKPYLIRWNILGQHIKLHKFLRSDSDCMHDHPWAFISILLWGHYYEETHELKPENVPAYRDSIMVSHSRIITKKYSAPCIIYRPAKHIHRLLIDGITWSLVINFKKVRSWGFWTKRGWVHWTNYKPTGSCE